MVDQAHAGEPAQRVLWLPPMRLGRFFRDDGPVRHGTALVLLAAVVDIIALDPCQHLDLDPELAARPLDGLVVGSADQDALGERGWREPPPT